MRNMGMIKKVKRTSSKKMNISEKLQILKEYFQKIYKVNAKKKFVHYVIQIISKNVLHALMILIMMHILKLKLAILYLLIQK